MYPQHQIPAYEFPSHNGKSNGTAQEQDLFDFYLVIIFHKYLQ